LLLWHSGQRAWVTDRLCSCFEHIVPVVGGGAKALDAGLQSHHGVRHVVAGGVGVKATIDLSRLIQQGLEPSWVVRLKALFCTLSISFPIGRHWSNIVPGQLIAA
jgi:hypothetical protein